MKKIKLSALLMVSISAALPLSVQAYHLGFDSITAERDGKSRKITDDGKNLHFLLGDKVDMQVSGHNSDGYYAVSCKITSPHNLPNYVRHRNCFSKPGIAHQEEKGIFSFSLPHSHFMAGENLPFELDGQFEHSFVNDEYYHLQRNLIIEANSGNVFTRDYAFQGNNKRSHLIFRPGDKKIWVNAQTTGSANLLISEFWQNHKLVSRDRLDSPDVDGRFNNRYITLPDQPGVYTVDTLAAYRSLSDPAIEQSPKSINDLYTVRIVDQLPSLSSNLSASSKNWISPAQLPLTLSFNITNWIFDLNQYVDAAFVDVVDSGELDHRYPVAIPGERETQFRPKQNLPENFWQHGLCRSFRAGLDYGQGRIPLSTRREICYDAVAPAVSWAGENRANEVRQVNSSNNRVIVKISASDTDSGLKDGKLRYRPHNADLQAWKEVSLSRCGKQWLAELTLAENDIVYEVQAQMNDIAGNQSRWTEYQQATFVVIENK